MSRNRRCFLDLPALVLLLGRALSARADSGAATTISAQGEALSRSTSAVSLAVDTSFTETGVSSTALPASVSAAAVSVPSVSATAVPPAPSAHVLVMDARDTPGKVIVGHGRRRSAAPGGALLVDRKNRRLEIVPETAAPASEDVEAPHAAPVIAAPVFAAPADAAAVDGEPSGAVAVRRRTAWRLVLGVGAAAFALGLAVR